MKIGSILFLALFTSVVFSAIILVSSEKNELDEVILEEIENGLINMIESKYSQIDGHLLEIEKDIKTVSLSQIPNEIFSQDQFVDPEIAREDVLQKSKTYAKEIENFILTNPEMTLSDLQNSLEFQSLAVQPIGKMGHSAIYSNNTKKILFHPIKEFIGKEYLEAMENSPKFLQSAEKIFAGKISSEGYYFWEDQDEIRKEKFEFHEAIPIKTKENISLVLISTAYLDDYKSIREISIESTERLKKFTESNNYYDVYLTSPEGNILYSARGKVPVGINLNYIGNLNLPLSKVYSKLNESDGFKFTGPFYFQEDIFLIATMPIYIEEKYFGSINILDYMENIYDILKSSVELEDVRELYLVNSELELISPSRFKSSEIFTQTIETENVLECIHSLLQGKEEDFEVKEFLNYLGELTIGVDYPISKVNWCLLSEINKEESLKILKDRKFSNKIYFEFGVAFIFVLIIFLMRIILNKKYKLSKRKTTEKRIALLEWMSKFEFLKKIKFSHAIIFSIAISSLTYFVIKLIFGLKKLSIDVGILKPIIMALFILVFRESFFCKKTKTKKYLFLGSLILIGSEILQMITFESILKFTFSLLLINILIKIIVIIGIVLLITGVSEELK